MLYVLFGFFEIAQSELFVGKMSSKIKVKSNGSVLVAGDSIDMDSLKSKLMETDSQIEERLANIFNRLDRNASGRIDIHDLTSALKGFGMSAQYAEVSYLCKDIICKYEKRISILNLKFYCIRIEIFERIGQQ